MSSLTAVNDLYAVSSNVVPESKYYEKLERLQSLGLIDHFISGIMPLSRDEFARQIKEAMAKMDKDPGLKNPMIDRILEDLKKEFDAELKGSNKTKTRIFEETSKEIIWLAEDPTPHLETNALNKPLVSERAGEDPTNGLNMITRVNGYIDFADVASFYIEPKLIYRQNGDNFDLDIARGYLKFGYGNMELQIGRDAQMWGYGFSGKMQLSNNIEGLTQIKFSTVHPSYLPWIFKYLGQFKFVGLFSVLESERDHPNPQFWAMAMMFKPFKFLEWGAGRTVMLQGKGTDDLSFWEYFFEAMTGARIYDSRKKNSGNGNFSIYALLTFPFLRGSQIFFDGYFEDMGFSNFFTRKTTFTRDLAFNTGLKIPRIDAHGRLSAMTEFVKTTQITYRNSVYLDGYTYNSDLIGHHIGPDAFGNYTRFTYRPDADMRFDLDLHYEKHGRTGLDQRSNPLDPAVFERPEERFGFVLSIAVDFMERFRADISAGYQRIENYAFQTGDVRNNAIGKISMNYRF